VQFLCKDDCLGAWKFFGKDILFIGGEICSGDGVNIFYYVGEDFLKQLVKFVC
jgi:hypothetical protein